MTERGLRKYARGVCPFRSAAGTWDWFRTGHHWWGSRYEEIGRATLSRRIYARLDDWFEQQSGCARFWKRGVAISSLIRAARAPKEKHA